MSPDATQTLSLQTVLVAIGVWALALIGVARYGERAPAWLMQHWATVYTLSLAVYCTAWTFYGTVTQATRSGWPLPPTFVGTILLFALCLPFLLKLAALAREQNSASVVDLVASRFGKSRLLASLLTLVCVLGMVPYIALQLKAVAQSFAALGGVGSESGPAWQDLAFWVAVAMAAFAMGFGTRRADATAHNRGLILAMAAESLFKLLVMLLLGGYALLALGGPADWVRAAAVQPPQWPSSSFLALILLGALAMVSLPHQFHVGFVELRDAAHLRRARVGFPLYLVLIALPTLPLAWAGRELLDPRVVTDLHVLALPLSRGDPVLALLAFLGGMSAATGMVVMAALTLSIMVAQHWLNPLLLRLDASPRGDAEGNLRAQALLHRRLSVAAVLLLAFLYSRAMGENDALADIGALSFSALALLAPSVIAAVYRPQLPAAGVIAGLIAGFAVWSMLLLWPTLLAAVSPAPREDPLLFGTLAALAANGVVALLWRPPAVPATPASALGVGVLRRLALRLLPEAEVQTLFFDHTDPSAADAALRARVERALAGVVGSATARALVDAASSRAGATDAPLEAVAAAVGQTSRALRFNQTVLEAALEHMGQGISVVDAELKLVAWNRRYAELFDYPAQLLQVGTPVRELVRHNAARGLLGDDPDTAVARRLSHMQAATPYRTERALPDGRIIEIRGNPLPGGGFVATFNDITATRAVEAELTRAKESLEERVAARTAELAEAKAEAEAANHAKTRLLAAVSHDLAQPINAARLFASALEPALRGGPHGPAIGNIERALSASEALLGGLLDISRLDAGGLKPEVQPVDLGALIAQLVEEHRAAANAKGLRLRAVNTRVWVASDPQLLRRVLQNFLGNAIRYTARGGVIIGLRRVGGRLRVWVVDTGIGIPVEDQRRVFEEFRRLQRGGQGLGLGLAIADRIARLLQHPLGLASASGRGTGFWIELPRVIAPMNSMSTPNPEPEPATRGTVLVVDNDLAVLDGMRVLLSAWGLRVCCASGRDEARTAGQSARPDLLLLDYQLDDGLTGLALLAELRRDWGPLPAVLITADHSVAVAAAARAAGCFLLNKPLKPLALRSLVNQLLPG
ncbi:MAG: PAS-domain containing protein [Xanthomonadales bacterium]|nr:PAS-domain containing protein [Xanthomonadales bacterium]